MASMSSLRPSLLSSAKARDFSFFSWGAQTAAIRDPDTAELEKSGDEMAIKASPVPEMYHERQQGRLCGMHTVNNMLQRRAFGVEELDLMEEELGLFEEGVQPSSYVRLSRCLCRSIGHSDFSVQTLDMALTSQGHELQWFDRRRGVAELDLDDPYLVGIIVNVLLDRRCCPISIVPANFQRHWFTILRVGDVFYDLDSRHAKPKLRGGREPTLTWLEDVLCDERSCVFRVTDVTWRPMEAAFGTDVHAGLPTLNL